MSERKQAKADLLVRVRYSLPLPPPPFPPKLLHIPTNPHRYGTYQTLQPLGQETALPMILDGELGLPLEVGKLAIGEYGDGSYWMGDRTAAAPPVATAPLDDDDLFLLGDANVSTSTGGFNASNSNAVSTHGAGSGQGDARKKVDVSWLRRTEYLSSEAGQKLTSANQGLGAVKALAQAAVELPRETRATAIASTFTAAAADVAILRHPHPTKAHLTAVEAWDVLPDADLWANQLDLIRFGEDPGEDRKHRTAADARLTAAIFRPLQLPNDDNRIGYFLPSDDKVADAYAKRRARVEETEGDEGAEAFEFRYMRDYEVANSRTLKEEFIFTFDDGPPTAEGEEDTRKVKRQRGAYFAALTEAQTLRKRRPKRDEKPRTFPEEAEEEGIKFWDSINLHVDSIARIDPNEASERAEFEDEQVNPPASL